MQFTDSSSPEPLERVSGDHRALGRPIETAAILDVDVRGRPTSSEFREFQRRFADAGVDARILEPEDLDYRNGKLVRREDGVPIDLVYKRLLFDDIMRERKLAVVSRAGRSG